MSKAKKLLKSFIAQSGWDKKIHIEQQATGISYITEIRVSGERCKFCLMADDTRDLIAVYVSLPFTCLDGQTHEALRLLNHLNSSVPFGCMSLLEINGQSHTLFRTAMELKGTVASVAAVSDMVMNTMSVLVGWIPPVKVVCTTVTTMEQAFKDTAAEHEKMQTDCKSFDSETDLFKDQFS